MLDSQQFLDSDAFCDLPPVDEPTAEGALLPTGDGPPTEVGAFTATDVEPPSAT